MKTGKIKPPADVLARIPKLRERLAKSVSGYVKVVRFKIPDRTALAVMIEQGEAEIFDSPVGRAYRLKGTQ